MRLLFRLPILLCWLTLLFFGWHCISDISKTAFAFEIDADRVVWNRLAYRAQSIFGKVSTHVNLMTVPVEDAAEVLITDPAGEALQPSGANMVTLTVDSNINPLFRSDEILKTQSWFEPSGAGALQRVRLRRGKDQWQKSYRFTKKGVFRLRKKPKDSSEENLPLDQWTKIRNHFYLYGDKGLGCPQILEPASLLYIVSAIDVTSSHNPLSLCVFNKKQLHKVQMKVAGKNRMKINFVEVAGENEVLRTGKIDSIKISFKIRSLAGPDQKAETFSFLGLKGDFDIYIDEASRIPVQVSGKISPFGKVDMRLHYVLLNPN